jgi:hypothetical protein
VPHLALNLSDPELAPAFGDYSDTRSLFPSTKAKKRREYNWSRRGCFNCDHMGTLESPRALFCFSCGYLLIPALEEETEQH